MIGPVLTVDLVERAQQKLVDRLILAGRQAIANPLKHVQPLEQPLVSPLVSILVQLFDILRSRQASAGVEVVAADHRWIELAGLIAQHYLVITATLITI